MEANMNYKNAYKKLKQYNQLHLLEHYHSLNASGQKSLLAQIDDINFDILDVLR